MIRLCIRVFAAMAVNLRQDLATIWDVSAAFVLHLTHPSCYLGQTQGTSEHANGRRGDNIHWLLIQDARDAQLTICQYFSRISTSHSTVLAPPAIPAKFHWLRQFLNLLQLCCTSESLKYRQSTGKAPAPGTTTLAARWHMGGRTT